MSEISSKEFLLALLFYLAFGCSGADNNSISKQLEGLGNLTEYSTVLETGYQVQFAREQAFGDTNEVFIGWLQAVDVDINGNVYVADGEELDIKVFQESGCYLGSIGKEGDGPGEFRNITSIETISNRIAVLDENRQTIQWFSAPNFDLLSTVQLKPAEDDMAIPRVADIVVVNDQFIILEYSEMITRSKRKKFYSLSRHNGEIKKENILEFRDADIFSDNTDGFAFAMVLPFARKPLVAVSGRSKIYVAHNDHFLVKEYNFDGEYNQGFYYPFQNVELLRDEVLDLYDNERIRQGIQNANFLDTWPALNDLLVDDENRLWISTIVEDFDVYEWWVLEESGELITKFEWPRDEPIEVVKNGYAYTRETDEETGLQQVVRYRIEMEEDSGE